MPHVHPDDLVSLTNNVSALPVPSNFFCSSTTGFLTPQEMVFAFDAGIQLGGGPGCQALQRGHICKIRLFVDFHFMLRTPARRARMANCLARSSPNLRMENCFLRTTPYCGLHVASQYFRLGLLCRLITRCTP